MDAKKVEDREVVGWPARLGPAVKNAARRVIGMDAARTPVPRKAKAPRSFTTYRGYRRNGARQLGRKYPRPTMAKPHDGHDCPHWWMGIRPNGGLHLPVFRANISRHRKPLYDPGLHKPTPKGKGFTVFGAMASFFFTPAQRAAAARMMGVATTDRRR